MLARSRGVAHPFTIQQFRYPPNSRGLVYYKLPLKPIDRDPAKPKRPLSAYLRFADEMRAQLKEKLPTERESVLLGEQWRALSETSKQAYRNAFQADQKVYDAAFAHYKSSGQEAKWLRPEGMPKRPLAGYVRFFMEYRKQNPEAVTARSTLDFSRICATAWKGLSADDKKIFDDIRKKELIEYNAKMEKFKASGALEAWKEKVGITRVEQQRQAEKERKVIQAREEKEKRTRLVRRQNRNLVSELLLKEREKEKARRERIRKQAICKRRKALTRAAQLEARVQSEKINIKNHFETVKQDKYRILKQYEIEKRNIMKQYETTKVQAREQLAKLKALEHEAKQLRKEARAHSATQRQVNQPPLPKLRYGDTHGKEWAFLRERLRVIK